MDLTMDMSLWRCHYGHVTMDAHRMSFGCPLWMSLWMRTVCRLDVHSGCHYGCEPYMSVWMSTMTDLLLQV